MLNIILAMKLIQPTEPAPIDIKKTMSALGEALENNQINGVIADIVNDVCTKIPSSKNDKVFKSLQDDNVEQKEAKDCKVIAKTNGDSQIEHEVSELDKIEPEVRENSVNASSANGLSNGNLSSESCRSPVSASPDISDIDKNIDLALKLISDSIEDTKENIVCEVDKNVDLSEKLISKSIEDIEEKIVCEIDKNIDVAEKNISDTIKETEENNMFCEVKKNVDLSEKLISGSIEETEEKIDSEIDKNDNLAEKLKSDSIHDIKENEVTSDSLKDIVENIVASNTILTEVPKVENTSKKVDTQASVSNEVILDINNSEQIQLLTENDTVTEESKEIENNITANEIQSRVTESPESIDDDIIGKQEKYDTVDAQMNDNSVVSIEAPIGKIDKELDTSLNGIISITNAAEDKLTSDIMENQDSNDNTHENKALSTDDTVKLSVENVDKMSSSNIDMELDINEPDISEIQEKSVKVESTIKNTTDMTSPISPASKITESNVTTNVSSEQESKVDQIHNESMDVEDADVSIVIPENNISDSTDKISILENSLRISDKNNTGTNKIEATKADNKIEISKEDSNTVMEIDDADDVTFVDKLSSDSILDKRSVENSTADDVKYCENSEKQDSVINIIDNDDEDKCNESESSEVKNDESSEVISFEDSVKDADPQESKKTVEREEKKLKSFDSKSELNVEKISKTPEKIVEKQLPVVCKLSNTMDILSDEEDETPVLKPTEGKKILSEEQKKFGENKCINIDDDDDIMFIEETNLPGSKNEEIKPVQESNKEETQTKEKVDSKIDLNESEVEKMSSTKKNEDEVPQIIEKADQTPKEDNKNIQKDEKKPVEPTVIKESKPIITRDFLKSVTKNLADMTRNELEDFCILKLVESVVDKSNLNEIKNKMKTMVQTVEELRKKALALTKQNRDLQVVVKTVQEEQKKRSITPMMPMKITRSVGMQVVLTPTEKVGQKRKQTAPPPLAPNKAVRNNQNAKTQKPPANIPVPRLVPASSPTVKSPVTTNTATKTTNKTTPQRPEKRPRSKVSPASSVTVDLTDDEPPTKVNTKPQTQVRLVAPQNLMAPKTRPQFAQPSTSPRKVYIPISSTNQNIRPGPAVLRNFLPTPRARQPAVVRMQAVRVQSPSVGRHPAPLPDAMKQYQPPAWKALPPAPDLKLSKVDNGIVISWKFEGYQPDSYEEVASFQLFAYQETQVPPSTTLWKKIGDIKALPLPMACTLTQFMSGFKYYFAVRAIDVRSRIGPFSLPGSIMLISKT